LPADAPAALLEQVAAELAAQLTELPSAKPPASAPP
jgi:hypothetical protein